MKDKINDLRYELTEFREVLMGFRYDIPEDTYKILYDLIYHSLISLKELEVVIRDECSKARDNS